MARFFSRLAALALHLRRDREGSVMTEFAIWTSVLFIALMAGMDFGGYYIARGAVNEAISAAAVQAFESRDEADFTAIPGYVRNLSERPSLAVTISCNGTTGSCTNTNRTCACLRTDATYSANTCGSPCSGAGMTPNSVAGYYLTIKASQTYEPLLVPDSLLAGTALTQATTVRLQ